MSLQIWFINRYRNCLQSDLDLGNKRYLYGDDAMIHIYSNHGEYRRCFKLCLFFNMVSAPEAQ